MKKLLLLSLCLVFIIQIFSIASAVPYTIGMYNISNQIYSGKANMLWVGDSLSSYAYPRVWAYGAMRTWNTTWRGDYIAWGAPGGQGWNFFNALGSPNANATSVGVGNGMFATYNLTGIAMQDTTYYLFLQDLGFGTQYGRLVLDSADYSSWIDDFSNNHPLSARLFYVSSPNATGGYTWYRLRNTSYTEGIAFEPMNESDGGIHYTELNMSASTGSSCCVEAGWEDVGQVENATGKNGFFPIGIKYFRSDISTGITMASSGIGGWNPQDHAGLNATKFYINASIYQFINGTDSNIFVIWLGQNTAPDEWNGVNTGQYQNHIRTIIDRYATAYYRVNTTNQRPMFILVSTWDTTTPDAQKIAQQADLINITQTQSSNVNWASNVTIGMINLRQYINDTNGSFTQWGGSYLGDGIHENEAGSIVFSRYMWMQLIRSGFQNNGTINAFTWISQSWTLENTTLGVNAGLFNNTDIYTQVLNVSVGIGSYLIYNESNDVVQSACTNGQLCPTPSMAYYVFNIKNGSYYYVLNALNISEIAPRAGSPFWYSLSNTTTKRIASNLSSTYSANTLNMTIYLNVSSCNIDSARYKSHTGTYNVTYTPQSFGWSCAGNLLQIRGVMIEPAQSSNEFFLTFTSQATSNLNTFCSNVTSGYSGFYGQIGTIFAILALGVVVFLLVILSNAVQNRSTDVNIDFMENWNIKLVFITILGLALLLYLIVVLFGVLCST